MPRPPFPHMAPYDIPLFASFILSDAANGYDRWEFDVAVGPGLDPGPFVDPALRENAIYLTQVRLDAVGWAGQIPTIFEVKPELSLTGFGQLLGYRWYFQQHTGIYPSLAGITDYMPYQYKILYDAHDIEVHQVKPAGQAGIFAAVEKVKRMSGGEIKPTRLIWTGIIPSGD